MLVTLAVLLILTATIFVVGSLLTEKMEQTIYAAVDAEAAGAATAVQAELQSLTKQVVLLAQVLGALAEKPEDLPDLFCTVAKIPAQQDSQNTQVWYMPVGAAIQGTEYDTDLEIWLQKAAQTLTPHLTHPLVRTVSDRKTSILLMIVPVLVQGELAGFAVMEIPAERIQQIVNAVNPLGHGYGFLFSGDRRYLAHPNLHQIGRSILEVRPGFYERDADVRAGRFRQETQTALATGEVSYFTFHPFQPPFATDPWSMAAVVSVTAVTQNARDSIQQIILLAFGAVLLISIVVYAIAKVVSGPIREMERESIRNREALRQSEEKLRITLHSIGDGVIVTDTDGKVTLLNPVAARLTGWAQQEAEGVPLSEVFHIVNEKTREPVENSVREVLQKQEIVELARGTILVSRNGKEHLVADSGAPICNPAGEVVGVVIVFRDVTEEFALQQRLYHSQKMDAIGQLAGGIAHDINNVLSCILGAAELLQLLESTNTEQRNYVEIILSSAERTAHLVRNLLTFSRKGPRARSPVRLEKVLEETVGLLVHTIDKRIHIQWNNKAGDLVVDGDAALLQSALMNMGINAGHAMQSGGTLTYSLERIVLDAPYCAASPFAIEPGEYAEISVRDTGCGIDAAVLRHIFEPFFTTKEQGKGTGLGLAAVYGTVLDHGGAVTVYSERNRGTVFHIYLPLTDQSAVYLQQEQEVVRGEGTILLVDDEEPIRITASAILSDLGYNVLCAADGKQGLQMFSEQRGQIDLVILDMIMPVCDGREVLNSLQEMGADVPVIIASGFDREDNNPVLQQPGVTGFLRKPFRRTQLAALVAQNIRKI